MVGDDISTLPCSIFQSLNEEIYNKKAEFEEYEFKISKIQSDSSTNAQTFRQRFDNAAETAKVWTILL